MIPTNARRVATPPSTAPIFIMEDGAKISAFVEYMQSFVTATEFTICEQGTDGFWYATDSQSVVGGDTLDAALATMCTQAGITQGANIADAKVWLGSRSLDAAYQDLDQRGWINGVLYSVISAELNQEYPTVPTPSGSVSPPLGGTAPAAGFLELVMYCISKGKIIRGVDSKLAIVKK